MLHLKKKDKVIVISGKDKGKTGEILKIFPDKSRLIISKINFIKRHTKTRQTQPGGILEKEAPINIAKVMLICNKCHQATRIKIDFLADGKKVRICKKCGEILV